MTGTVWMLIGIAAGAAGTGLLMFARALRNAFRALPATIDDLLDTEIEEALDSDYDPPYIEDDVWDYDLRILLTETLD